MMSNLRRSEDEREHTHNSCVEQGLLRCLDPIKTVITAQQRELTQAIIAKVISIAAKPVNQIAFISLTLHTHTSLFLSHDCCSSCFRLSLNQRTLSNYTGCVYECLLFSVDRINQMFFYISVFLLPLQIETRRRPKVKNCLVLWCGNLAATPDRVFSLIVLHPARGERGVFPSTTFVCSPSSSSLFILSSPLASAVLLYLRHSGIKLRDSKVFPGLSTEKEKWLAFLKTKKVRVPAAPWRVIKLLKADLRCLVLSAVSCRVLSYALRLLLGAL